MTKTNPHGWTDQPNYRYPCCLGSPQEGHKSHCEAAQPVEDAQVRGNGLETRAEQVRKWVLAKMPFFEVGGNLDCGLSHVSPDTMYELLEEWGASERERALEEAAVFFLTESHSADMTWTAQRIVHAIRALKGEP